MPHGMDFWNTVHGNCGQATWPGLLECCPRQLWPGHLAWTSGILSTAIVARPLGLDFWNTVHGKCRGHKQRTAQRPALKGQPQLWPCHMAWTSGMLSTACAVATNRGLRSSHSNCGQATWPGLLEHCPRQLWPGHLAWTSGMLSTAGAVATNRGLRSDRP
jgi:hypothetical protein